MYLEIIFFALIFLLLHTYIIFPLTLPIFSEIFRLTQKQTASARKELPSVSLLISAYNEEAIIEKKIMNCLELDYPAEKLQILIGNDGSSDRTAEIISRYTPRVTLIHAPHNQGKAAMLNRLQKEATGEILVFCDANTLFFPNVIRKITRPFADPRIGCVCGHLILNDQSDSALGKGETTYWDFESEIKKFEGQAGVVIGGNGAIYAIRKQLYTPLPTHKSIMDDFFITVKVLEQGYLSTFVSSAIGTEQTSKSASGEFLRKIRIGRANFNFLWSYLPLLNPLRPLVAYFFFSHKLLRWFSPHIAISALIINGFLFFKHPIFALTLSVQFVIFLSALIGWIYSRRGRKLVFCSTAFYFITMNYALLKGFFLSFIPQKSGGWARIERGDE